MNHELRRDRLRRLLRKEGIGAMLITNFTNVSYLTGFTGDDSYLLVMSSGQVLLSDFRYGEQLESECRGLDVEIRRQGTTMLQSLARLLKKTKLSRVAVEADSMTVGLFEQMRDKMPKVELVAAGALVEELRQIKDKEEIGHLRFAAQCAERAFEVIRASLRPDQTELEVANELEYQIRLFGGSGCSFPPIVAVGPRAALPHASPTNRQIHQSDFVLIDWGATGRQYRSDLTRVLVTGKISPKLRKIYGVVLKAQRRAIRAVRPGASMHNVDRAARGVITNSGYGRRFGHGLGHGIGLDIHEAPRLGVNQKQPLRAGMVITIEPGIYVPGWGGVRIEDDVLVTRAGHEVLTSTTKQLDECVVG